MASNGTGPYNLDTHIKRCAQLYMVRNATEAEKQVFVRPGSCLREPACCDTLATDERSSVCGMLSPMEMGYAYTWHMRLLPCLLLLLLLPGVPHRKAPPYRLPDVAGLPMGKGSFEILVGECLETE
jgi:hypothetical protein